MSNFCIIGFLWGQWPQNRCPFWDLRNIISPQILPQTTTIIRWSIFTTTPSFFSSPIRQCFNFTTNLITYLTTNYYHKPLTFLGSQYRLPHQLFSPIWQCFNYNKNVTTHFTKTTIFLQQTTIDTTMPPPTMFLYLRERHTNVLRGLQRFWEVCKDLARISEEEQEE